MRRVIIGVSREIGYDLRNDFFAHLETHAARVFPAQRRTGDLMSRATNDLNAVRMMIGPVGDVPRQHAADVRRRRSC